MAEQETYQSLYRRFRPQRWAEVKGQDHVTVALRNAVRDERVSHAYLFSGPRGTGKTTSARILAKALNCTNMLEGEPCDECESCVLVTAGNSLDVQELDAASNNGVDAMRDLVSRAALTTPGRWKVYIVDEVHMLSPAASNALLKTLEEPPSHVIFVLATTDPQKVLSTIRSRAQHYEFRLLGGEVLAELVRDVAKKAELGVASDALESAARRGQGSARDALSALDQVAAGGGLDLEDQDVAGEIVDALAVPDAGAALVAVARALQRGRDPRRIGEEVLDTLRQAFLMLMAPELAQTVGDTARLAAQAKKIGPPGITRALEAVGEAVTSMKEAVDPRIALETALVRVARADLDIAPSALLERLDRLERQMAVQGERAPREAPLPATPPAASPPSAPPDPSAPRPSLGIARPAATAAEPEPHDTPAMAQPPTIAAPPADDNAPQPTRDELTLAWGDSVLASLPQKSRARFRGGQFVEATTPTFSLPTEIHRQRCEEVRVEVQQALSEHFGRRINLALTVGPAPMPTDTGPTPTDLRVEEEMEDVGNVADLDDAPAAVTSASARLLEAFPGATEEGE